MKPTTTVVARSRRNRVLVALATAWIILSLALGGMVTAESRGDAAAATAVSSAQR